MSQLLASTRVPTDVSRTAPARVAVVGAGVVGAAVARGLAAGGSRVLVLEAAEPGAGTSGTSFAWINASAKEPRPYFDLNVAAMRLHREEGAGN